VPYGKPLVRTREYIEIMRKIFARQEPVAYDGKEYQIPYRGPGASGLGKPLRSILHGRADIPIVTATISPKAIELAAEVADGFIPIWTAPSGIENFKPALDKGFAKAGPGKKREGFEIMPFVNAIVHDDVAKCRDIVRPFIALYVGGMGARDKNFYNDHVSRQGWPDAAKKIQDLYLGGQKNDAVAAVPDDLCDRLAAWKEAPATTLILQGPNKKTLETMAELCL
jgi:F420-dependent oxidoreductase-like protein